MYVQNPPGSTFPHPDTPKSCPISPIPIRIYPNPAQFYTQTFDEDFFGAYAFASLHGYMKNLTGFTFPHTDTPKTHPISPIPNKDTPKTHPVLGANPCRRTFGDVCNTPLHGYMKNLTDFIFPHTYPPKNAPDFTTPNRDTPKSRPVLYPNLRRRTFRGVCFCAPTRVRAKFDGFHISAYGYTENAPDFTFPNRDTPKARPVLGANLRRGAFRGVCNTPLHGYMQNLAGFRPKPSARIVSGRMQYAPTRVHAKFGGFHISAHDMTRNLPGFRPKPSSQDISGRMQYAPTRVHQKPGGFWILPHDIARNPAGFGLCHSTWRKTRRFFNFATRHSAKPGGFWTLPHDMARNSAGFGLCHTT